MILKECKTRECQNKIATATVERKRKRGSLCSWREEIEEGLRMAGIKKDAGNG
jgi:hypothetical protein